MVPVGPMSAAARRTRALGLSSGTGGGGWDGRHAGWSDAVTLCLRKRSGVRNNRAFPFTFPDEIARQRAAVGLMPAVTGVADGYTHVANGHLIGEPWLFVAFSSEDGLLAGMLPGVAELVHHRQMCVRLGGVSSDGHMQYVSDLLSLERVDGKLLSLPECVERVNHHPECFSADELNTMLLSPDVHASVRADGTNAVQYSRGPAANSVPLSSSSTGGDALAPSGLP